MTRDYRTAATVHDTSGGGWLHPHFIVHARKAVLGGLSPRENREVPPLRFDVVQRLKT
jgi:hypothetical protein